MGNKSWNNDSKHTSFESADTRRKDLLTQNSEDFLAKVKFLNSENRFVVKTWSPPEEKSEKGDKDKAQKKGKPKTRAQRRALKEKRKRERESNA